MKTIIKRLTEPSTYGSLAGLLLLLGVNVEDEWVELAAQAGGVVAGVLGIILAERGKD